MPTDTTTAARCEGCRTALGYWHDRICGACTVKRRDGLCLRPQCYALLGDEEWEGGFCQAHRPIAVSTYYAKPKDGPRAWSLAWRKQHVPS